MELIDRKYLSLLALDLCGNADGENISSVQYDVVEGGL